MILSITIVSIIIFYLALIGVLSYGFDNVKHFIFKTSLTKPNFQ